MARVADALQIGLAIGSASSLVDDVINLGRRCHNAQGKAHLAQVLVPLQYPLAKLAPRPVISAIIGADLGDLLPPIKQMYVGRAVAMPFGGQLMTGALSAHLGNSWRHGCYLVGAAPAHVNAGRPTRWESDPVRLFGYCWEIREW